MQETSEHSAYNLSEHSVDKNRLNEFSFSLKRDFHKAGLGNEMEDGASCSDDDDDGSDKQEETTVKKIPPPNGKKTKGRVKIKMEFIDNKLRRYTTFSKRKTGIMKKAYELSTLTGTQVMLLVASETGHVYTFATRKLQPMITSEAGKALIQTCLNSPDPLVHAGHHSDQRMSATGFEETELTYTINDEDCKMEGMPNKSHLPLGSDSSSIQSSLSQMSLPVPSSLINSHSQMAAKNNNISMHLPKQHTGFTTILTPGSNMNTNDSPTAVAVISGPHSGTNSNSSLPLMYQTVYTPTTTAEGVLLSLGQNFNQETRTSGGHQFITVPVSINPSSHQTLMKQTNSKWSLSDSQLLQHDDFSSVTDLSKHGKRND